MNVPFRVVPTVAALMLLLAHSVQAAEGPDGNGPRAQKAPSACQSDVKRLCPNVKPGDGRIVACLREHKSELSPACKAEQERAREKAEKKVEHAKKACEADTQKFCKGIDPGQGRVVKCLKEHKKDLSGVCRRSLDHKGPPDGDRNKEKSG